MFSQWWCKRAHIQREEGGRLSSRSLPSSLDGSAASRLGPPSLDCRKQQKKGNTATVLHKLRILRRRMYLLPLTFLAAPSCNAFGIVAVCAMAGSAVRRDSWLPRTTNRYLFSKLPFRTIETIRYTMRVCTRMRNVSITRVDVHAFVQELC